MKIIYILLLLLTANCSQKYRQFDEFNYSNSRKLIEKNRHKSVFLSNDQVINYSSSEGIEIFRNAEYINDFFALSPFYESQRYMSTCGPASLRIVLSALYEKMEKSFILDQDYSLTKHANGIDYFMFRMTESNIHKYYKSKSYYDNYQVLARQKKKVDGSYGSGYGGFSIEDIAKSHPGITAKYFLANNLSTQITQGQYKRLVDQNIDCTENCNVLKSSGLMPDSGAIEAGIADLRNRLKAILKSDSDFIISYHSHVKTVPGIFSGHFSPIAAFDEKTDMVLIMDVAAHIQNWYWIKLSDLYKSMSFDNGGQDRGYIVISLEKSEIAQNMNH